MQRLSKALLLPHTDPPFKVMVMLEIYNIFSA